MAALIELEELRFAYAATDRATQPALSDVTLQIETGEYVAIIGANGSGKSTLARHLNALLLPTSGVVRIAGMDTRDQTHRRAIRQTVGMVFQRPDDQIIAATIEEDVAFGPENIGLPPDEIRARVRKALETVNVWDVRLRPPHHLSAGQMQRVALAGVLAMQPRCIVFDEATAMLDPAGRRTVRLMMAQLHAEGITVITITHFMDEATEAKRVIVMDQGRVALDAPPAQVFAEDHALQALSLELPPIALLTQRLRQSFPELPPNLLTAPALTSALDALPHNTTAAPSVASQAPPAGRTLIEVEKLGHVYLKATPLEHRALHNVNLVIPEGGSHGLLGATGSGKSTLLQHLNGLLRPQEGKVRIGDFNLNDPRVDLRAVRRSAGLAFQMPELQIFEQYVGDEIAFGPRLQGLQGATLRERVRWAMGLVGLDFDTFKDRLTFALSGGERRKVALASVLALQPAILLLDEPTAGLDPISRRELLAHLQALRNTGMTLVISSHRMEDLARMAETLTVMAGGSSILSGAASDVFAEEGQLRSLGLGLPVVAEIASALRARGWPLSPNVLTAEVLVAQLMEITSRA
ncbi:MAG: putative HMP/thiamine import ATP-binding protein YkoD [Chloroflexi bacterium ADurb.Bin360]|nr:MAG: putative HMP/thiamine import ATP-binding protein YkoD [Chloroflexi bacterium ADurb.Bin360]